MYQKLRIIVASVKTKRHLTCVKTCKKPVCPLSCISISVSRDDELVASDGWSQDEFCLDIISPPVTWSWSWSSPRHQLWSQIWAITTNVPLSIYSVQPTPAATAHTDPAPGDKNSLVKLNQTFISSLLWERRIGKGSKEKWTQLHTRLYTKERSFFSRDL